MTQRLPHTEGIVPVRHNTEKLRVIDKHPALVESERVLRLLYDAVAAYDKRCPGMLPASVRNAVLVLRDALFNHSLIEQSIRLQVAVAEINTYPTIATHFKIYHAMREVNAFLALPLPEEGMR